MSETFALAALATFLLGMFALAAWSDWLAGRARPAGPQVGCPHGCKDRAHDVGNDTRTDATRTVEFRCGTCGCWYVETTRRVNVGQEAA